MVSETKKKRRTSFLRNLFNNKMTAVAAKHASNPKVTLPNEAIVHTIDRDKQAVEDYLNKFLSPGLIALRFDYCNTHALLGDRQLTSVLIYNPSQYELTYSDTSRFFNFADIHDVEAMGLYHKDDKVINEQTLSQLKTSLKEEVGNSFLARTQRQKFNQYIDALEEQNIDNSVHLSNT